MPAYSNTGPFVNNTTPGISATFLNNIENFLDSINSSAYDTHVSSDGSGNVTIASVKFATGIIKAINWGFIASLTNAGQTITHGLGGTPAFVKGQVSAGTGRTDSVLTYVTSLSATTFLISTNSASNFPVWWLAIR